MEGPVSTLARRSTLSTASWSAVKPASAAAGRAMKSRSQPDRIGVCRTTSRIRRRTRFLTTALCVTLRPTTKAKRG